MSSKKGGLGRNLDSLIPTPINRVGSNETVGERSEIPLTWIKPNPRQPRTVFDNAALKNSLHQLKR